MTSLGAVLSLYRERKLLWLLAAGLLLIMPSTYAVSVAQDWVLFESCISLWLLAWMSLAFQFGIMIKRQLVSPMAGLLPGYRRAHIGVGVLLWILTILITALWMIYVGQDMPLRLRLGWVLLTQGAFLMTILMAYISERFLLILGYGLLLCLVLGIRSLLEALFFSDIFFYGMMSAGFLLLGGFVARLFSLREGMAEYSLLLSWPLHRSSSGRVQRVYTYQKMTPFFHKQGLLNQASHWGLCDAGTSVSRALIVLGALGFMGAYVFFDKAQTGFYWRPFTNFLLLVMVPLFITLCFYHRAVAFKDYALMLPLTRRSLSLQWGVFLSWRLFFVWVLSSLILMVFPAWALKMDYLNSFKFWIFLLNTGIFAQMNLFWLMYMAVLTRSSSIITHVLISLFCVMAQVLIMPMADTGFLLFETLIFSGATGVLAWLAYKKSYRKEG